MSRRAVQSWVVNAACRGTDPDAFHDSSTEVMRQAKKVCRSCEVQMECLNDALIRNDPFGVWGGTEPRERRRLNLIAVA